MRRSLLDRGYLMCDRSSAGNNILLKVTWVCEENSECENHYHRIDWVEERATTWIPLAIQILQFNAFFGVDMPTCVGVEIQVVFFLWSRVYDLVIFGPLSPESAA